MSRKEEHLLSVVRGQFDSYPGVSEAAFELHIATLHLGDTVRWCTPPYSEDADQKKHNAKLQTELCKK